MIKGTLKQTFGSFVLDINLEIPSTGVTTFFGPSGAGKTSLLRWIAGLSPATEGCLSLAEELWEDTSQKIFVPAFERRVGYVFQEDNLFPHLNVKENLKYPLKRLRKEKPLVSLDFAIELLGIEHLLQRNPISLSGGERQRVAIARSLLVAPKVLLLDEPLASLDSKSKGDILPYLARLKRETSIPILFVTHSSSEVSALSDIVLHIDDGKIIKKEASEKSFKEDGPIIVALNPTLIDKVQELLKEEGKVVGRIFKRSERVLIESWASDKVSHFDFLLTDGSFPSPTVALLEQTDPLLVVQSLHLVKLP